MHNEVEQVRWVRLREEGVVDEPVQNMPSHAGGQHDRHMRQTIVKAPVWDKRLRGRRAGAHAWLGGGPHLGAESAAAVEAAAGCFGRCAGDGSAGRGRAVDSSAAHLEEVCIAVSGWPLRIDARNGPTGVMDCTHTRRRRGVMIAGCATSSCTAVRHERANQPLPLPWPKA